MKNTDRQIELLIAESDKHLYTNLNLLTESELGSRSKWIKSAAFIVYHSNTEEFTDDAHCTLLADDEPLASYTLGELRAQPEFDAAA